MDISMFNVTLLLNVLKGPDNQTYHINSEIQKTAITKTTSYRDSQAILNFTKLYDVQLLSECPQFDQYDVRFLLFTRNYYGNYNLTVTDNSAKLKYTTYRVNKKTKVIVHGWLQNGLSFGQLFAQAYFGAEKDLNVVGVDWSRYSNCDYFYTVQNVVPKVGHTVGKFVSELLDYGSTAHDIQIIGHSLGSHISGFAGKYLKPASLSRITGLDPAGPGYNDVPSEKRLDSTDAHFVDIIHTSSTRLGFNTPSGTADFWPNGGVSQPMCESDDVNCSHQMSFNFYIDSITYAYTYCASNCTNYVDYLNHKCNNNDVEYMGEYLSNGARGNYYLNTRNYSPYGFPC